MASLTARSKLVAKNWANSSISTLWFSLISMSSWVVFRRIGNIRSPSCRCVVACTYVCYASRRPKSQYFLHKKKAARRPGLLLGWWDRVGAKGQAKRDRTWRVYIYIYASRRLQRKPRQRGGHGDSEFSKQVSQRSTYFSASKRSENTRTNLTRRIFFVKINLSLPRWSVRNYACEIMT